MKIALAQLNYHVGNFSYNLKKITDSIRQAVLDSADLIVFSELAVCGYPPRDFLQYDEFIKRCTQSVESLLPETHTIDCIIGSPWPNPAPAGKKIYNAAAHLSKGKIKNLVFKTLLPTYDVFDECRYFEPAFSSRCIEVKGTKIALTICEDLWNIETDQYTQNPMDRLILEKPDLMINLAASPFSYTQQEDRLRVLRANVARYDCPLIYVNHVGAQTDLIFDGGSMALDVQGRVANQADYFSEEVVQVDLANLKRASQVLTTPAPESFRAPADPGSGSSPANSQTVPSPSLQSPRGLGVAGYLPTDIPGLFTQSESLKSIHRALVLGIRDFFRKSGFTQAVLGLSGGIDSALVAVLAAEALGAKNVLAVRLPSQFSSPHSLTDADALVKAVGMPSFQIPIEAITGEVEQALRPLFGDRPFSIAEENIQSRTRAVLLMAISNKLGYILLNTSNKSEGAVGYGTLYGDMCGALSVLGDVYKTQVFALSRYLNTFTDLIPESILTKAPSAELRPDQKDSDSLPDYDLLDPILFGYIEQNKDYRQLVKDGFPAGVVSQTVALVNKAEFKRHQAAPILRISPRAFGMGRRMPITGTYEY